MSVAIIFFVIGFHLLEIIEIPFIGKTNQPVFRKTRNIGCFYFRQNSSRRSSVSGWFGDLHKWCTGHIHSYYYLPVLYDISHYGKD